MWKGFAAGLFMGFLTASICIGLVNPPSVFRLFAPSFARKIEADPFYRRARQADKSCEERFFATTTDGRIIPLSPMDTPVLDTAAIMSWTTTALVQALTFSFNDIDERQNRIADNFLPSGWDEYQSYLKGQELIERAIREQMIMSAVPKGFPKLLQKGAVDGVYRWKLQLPTVLTYKSAGNVVSVEKSFDISVSRTPIVDSKSGVAITSFKVVD